MAINCYSDPDFQIVMTPIIMKTIIAFILFIPLFSFALDAEVGVVLNEDVKDSLWETSIPYAIARQGQRSVDPSQSVIAFLDFTDYVISLSTDARLIKTAKKDRIVDGVLKIKWLSETALESAVVSRYRFVNYSYDSIMMGVDHPLGCLREAPLRYGDLENDGKKDIYLFIGNDFFIFSPDTKKTVFQSKLRIDDWFTLEETNEQFENHSYYAKSDKRPQYLSAANPDWLMKEEPLAGYRGYAKLYFSDFDADGAFDILVWRKLYESHLNADPVKGFIKKSDTFVHYKLVNGEYKKQTTDTATIRSWLTAKQLTWQKGYPSKSECPGQEGQLIPEMHDPLLNDPDVLQ